LFVDLPAGDAKMGFLGVYKAIYDYVPQGESELAISEGDILYVLEKSGEDDWWRAKKKASGEDDDEPVGLIPNNYIEEVCTGTRIFRSTQRSDCWRATCLSLLVQHDMSFNIVGTLEVFMILTSGIGTTILPRSCAVRLYSTDR
jgi:hypothetical protein